MKRTFIRAVLLAATVAFGVSAHAETDCSGLTGESLQKCAATHGLVSASGSAGEPSVPVVYGESETFVGATTTGIVKLSEIENQVSAIKTSLEQFSSQAAKLRTDVPHTIGEVHAPNMDRFVDLAIHGMKDLTASLQHFGNGKTSKFDREGLRLKEAIRKTYAYNFGNDILDSPVFELTQIHSSGTHTINLGDDVEGNPIIARYGVTPGLYHNDIENDLNILLTSRLADGTIRFARAVITKGQVQPGGAIERVMFIWEPGGFRNIDHHLAYFNAPVGSHVHNFLKSGDDPGVAFAYETPEDKPNVAREAVMK